MKNTVTANGLQHTIIEIENSVNELYKKNWLIENERDNVLKFVTGDYFRAGDERIIQTENGFVKLGCLVKLYQITSTVEI